MFVKVIDPLIDRLGVDPLSVNVEDFIIQRLKDDPLTRNLDIESAGSFFKDTIVRALVLILEPLQREVAFLKTQQSFNSIDSLNRDEVDALLANIFSVRKFGDFADGVARVYYSAPQAVSVDASIIFSTPAGLQFIPSEPQTRVDSDFVREGDLYYIEFDIQSIVPHVGANIDADQIRTVTGLPNVVRVTNPNALGGGVTEETNEEAVRRGERSLTERSMNTKRGIQTELFNNFDNIESIDVVGYRDPEMNRDILTGTVTLGLEEVPGETLYTTVAFTGIDISKDGPGSPGTTSTTAEKLPDWPHEESNFPFTNVFQLNFATFAALENVWEKVKDATLLRLFDTTETYDEKQLSLVRTIRDIKTYDAGSPPVEVAASDTDARNIWIFVDDFEIVAHGDFANTAPHDNTNSDQGTEYHLKESVNNFWRGAPLPFTDVVELLNSSTLNIMDGYSVLTDRDFLVLRGYRDGLSTDPIAENYYRVFPLRGWDGANDKARILRSDYTMISRRKVGLPIDYKFDKTIYAGLETPEVVSYGAPGPHAETDKTKVFDGVSTVDNGAANMGGVAIFQLDGSQEADTYVELAAHGSRPNGWESLGVEVGHFISLAGSDEYTHPDTNDTYNVDGAFDFWMWARVSAVGVGGNKHLIKVEGIEDGPLAAGILGFTSSVEAPPELTAIGTPWWGFPRTTVTYSGIANGPFVVGNTITGNTSGATGEIESDTGTVLTLINVVGTFQVAETIQSGATTATVDATNGSQERYRLHWAVYRGELEVLLQNNNLSTSYDDFAFMPAYDNTGQALYIPTPSYLPGPGGTPLHSDSFPTWDGKMYALNAVVLGYPVPPWLINRCNWAIIRLGKRFQDIKQDDGSLVVAADPSAQKIPVSGVAATAAKYPEVVSGEVIYAEVLPAMPAAYKWDDVGGPTAALTEGGPGGSPNLRGIRGGVAPSYINSAGEEFLQVYGELEATLSNPILTISDIPGSFPFTDEFGPPLTVNSGEVHIGGMTDVYLKGSSVELEAAEFSLYPKDIEVGNDKDIIFEATDGIVTAAEPKVISSPSLSSLFTAEELEGLNNYVVEVVDSSETSAIGFASRIIDVDHTLSVIRAPDDFNDTVLDITVSFRIYKEVTTNLNDPRRTWLTGNDLFIPLEASFVTSAIGFDSLPSDEGTLYIEIFEGASAGVYVIIDVEPNKLLLDVPMNGPESDVSFTIFTRSTGVGTPLVRVKSVTLASEEGSGVAIPPKDPVDVLAESFSGLNNDPIEFNGTLVLRPAGPYPAGPGVPTHTEGTFDYAQLYTDPSFDFAAQGIAKFDVVRLEGLDEEDTFWFVREVAGTPIGTVLVLDRDSTIIETDSLTGTVGKSSLGEVRVFFTEPTYFEVNPDTVLKTTDGLLSFRPSPAEESDVYETPFTSTDVLITPAVPDDAVLDSQLLDFSKLDIRVGDQVEITRTALLSSDILNATADDMSSLIGKALVFRVDGVQRSMLFTSGGTLTLTEVVSQINTKLGGFLRAANVAGEPPNEATHRRLAVYSEALVEVLDSSPGVLTLLGLTVGQDNDYPLVIADVTDVDYDVSTTTSTLVLKAKSSTVFTTYDKELFFKVVRPEHQVVYPGDMIEDDTGLFYFEFTAASRFPLIDQKVAENTQMTISGYTSLGYRLLVDNDNYSFSAAEIVDIATTPVVLPATAVNFNDAFICPTSAIEVSYERSQLVEDVQAFLLTDTNRVVNNNPLSRHYLPAYLHMSIKTEGGKDVDNLKADLVKYLLSLFPNKTLETYDIERVMVQGGVESVEHPVSLVFLVHNADRTIEARRSENAITLDSRFHIMEDEEHIFVTRI
jgi:hypothetical protein